MVLTQKFDDPIKKHIFADYIPIACHYDKNSLLTKNGFLLQTIEILGVDLSKITNDPSGIRSFIRQAINNIFQCKDYSFWIHTIRSKIDLRSPESYHNLFAQNINHFWDEQHYLGHTHVNNLYITVLSAVPQATKYSSNLLKALFLSEESQNAHDTNLKKYSALLSAKVNDLVTALSTYGARKLDIRFSESSDECYSDLAHLYKQILHASSEDFSLSNTDLSKALESVSYNIESDTITIINKKDNKTKYANILSLKEYHELSDEKLDILLQIACDMVITEIIYPVAKSEIMEAYKEQNSMLKAAKDNILTKLKSFDKIFSSEGNSGEGFCRHQISVMLFCEDRNRLKSKTLNFANILKANGLVHVMEDINLEKIFWSQLPGNFLSAYRMGFNSMANIGGFAALYQLPLGNFYNLWGRALITFSTTRGSPYFFNFHDHNAQAKIAILGTKGTGKTTLINMLTALSDKYLPNIIYLTSHSNSDLHIKMTGGSFLSKNLSKIMNPFLYEDHLDNRQDVLEFLKIILLHYYDPLSPGEMQELENLVHLIFTLPLKERVLSSILTKFLSALKLQNHSFAKRCSYYLENGEYHELFEAKKNIDFAAKTIFACNLSSLQEEKYVKEQYPCDSKLLPAFEYSLNALRAVKVGIFFGLNMILTRSNANNGRGVFSVDDMLEILDVTRYASVIERIFDDIDISKAVLMLSMDLSKLCTMRDNNIKLSWLDEIDSKIMIASELIPPSSYEIMGIKEQRHYISDEVSKGSRIVVINQDNESSIVKFDLTSNVAICRILSGDESEKKILAELLKKHGSKISLSELLPSLYEKLNQVSN